MSLRHTNSSPPSVSTQSLVRVDDEARFRTLAARRHGCRVGLFVLLVSVAVAAEDNAPRRRPLTPLMGTAIWGTIQLIPHPLLAIGSNGPGGGVRWQVTPLVYSFGITERPLRYFIVSPVARHSGAVEFFGSPEWTCCSGAGNSGWLGRFGTRLYLPVIGRGELLAMSLGGSYYYENRRHGGAGEFGLYTFSSIFGLSVTVAPWLHGRETLVALTWHYF